MFRMFFRGQNVTGWILLLVSPALASSLLYASTNYCCTGVNTTSCSGCVDMGLGYLSVGTNPVGFCEAYVNPIECEMGKRVCFDGGEGFIPVYSDAGCENVNGSFAGVQLSVDSCQPDSCD
jgi:hypothetical protein